MKLARSAITEAISVTSSDHDNMQWFLAFVFLLLLVANTIFNKPVLALTLLVYFPFAVTNIFSCLRQSALLLVKPSAMGLLWLLFMASYSWSAVPSASMEQILTLSAFMLLALVVTVRHQDQGFVIPLRLAAQWLICLVVVYCLIAFRGAFMAGRLTAFYHQKNNLGAMMGLCTLLLFFAPKRQLSHIGFGVAAVALLLASQSKTSIVLILVCSLLVLVANWWVEKNYPDSAIGQTSKNIMVRPMLYRFALLLLIVIVLFRDQLLDLMWSDFTKDMLTGRGTLWLIVVQHIRGNSLLGIGPGTFWDAAGASEIAHTYLYMLDPGWIQNMVSADGSYIDLIASVGFLGLALFLLTAVEFYRRVFRQWQQPESRLMFVLVTFVLLHAVTETTLLASTNILWFTYLLCYFRVVSRANTSQGQRRVNGPVNRQRQ